MKSRDVVDAKIESIGRCLSRIRAHTPASARELLDDYDAQDIISLNLQRAIQLCADIAAHVIAIRNWKSPETLGEGFSELARHHVVDSDIANRLQRAVAFRNISVHEYRSIDWNIVHRYVSTRLGDFESYISSILRYLDS